MEGKDGAKSVELSVGEAKKEDGGVASSAEGASKIALNDAEHLIDVINGELVQMKNDAWSDMKQTEEVVDALSQRTSESFQETQSKLRERVNSMKDVTAKVSSVTQSFFEPVPLHIPLERRLQTLAIMLWVVIFMFPGMLIFYAISALLLLHKYTAMAIAPYLLWTVTVDRKTPCTGTRKPVLRDLKIWKYMAQFFPAKLVKTVPLSTEKRYIFGIHPHGVISFGAFMNFATEGTGFSQCFPGIHVRLCTLDAHFYAPVYREMLLSLGIVGASRSTFLTLCDDTKPETAGNAVAVVIGGAAEALESAPGVYSLLVGRRKGFVRMALRTGASLVPVISFGETNVYNTMSNPVGSYLRRLQELVKNVSGIAPVAFYGRGSFNYAFGFLPFRRRIVTVVGKPIDVPKYHGADVYTDPEGEKLADEYHEKYIQALSTLFEENVHKYDENYVRFSTTS